MALEKKKQSDLSHSVVVVFISIGPNISKQVSVKPKMPFDEFKSFADQNETILAVLYLQFAPMPPRRMMAFLDINT